MNGGQSRGCTNRLPAACRPGQPTRIWGLELLRPLQQSAGSSRGEHKARGAAGRFPGPLTAQRSHCLFSGSPRESWGLSAAAGASAGCDCQSPGLLCLTLPPSWGLRPSLSIFLRRCARLTLSQGQRVVQGAKIPGCAGGRGLGGLGSGAVGVGDCTALARYRPSSHQGPSPPGWAMSQEIRPCHLLRIEETPWLAARESLTRIQ